jgi:hypothetical protein
MGVRIGFSKVISVLRLVLESFLMDLTSVLLTHVS